MWKGNGRIRGLRSQIDENARWERWDGLRMARARSRAMTGTDNGEGRGWRALQNRVIRERNEMKIHIVGTSGRKGGPRLPHKHAKREGEGKGGLILPSPQRGQTR